MLWECLVLLLVVGKTSADYTACMENTEHVEYAGYCYEMFMQGSPKSVANAEDRCQAEGGHMAVVVSDRLRERIAAEVIGSSHVFLPLYQMNTNDRIKDHWFWQIPGVLYLSADADNMIRWRSGDPDDGSSANSPEDSDGGVQDNAIMMPSGKIRDFHSSHSSFAETLCQFRKPKALFDVYAEGKALTVQDRPTPPPVMNIDNADYCAMRCYIDPSCLAMAYNSWTKVCQFYFDRPEDYAATTLVDDPNSNVWSKAS